MVQLTIELPDDLYERLCAEAERQSKTVEALVVEILTQYLATLDKLEAPEVVESNQ